MQINLERCSTGRVFERSKQRSEARRVPWLIQVYFRLWFLYILYTVNYVIAKLYGLYGPSIAAFISHVCLFVFKIKVQKLECLMISVSSGQGWYRFANVFKVFAQKNVAYFEAVTEKCFGKYVVEKDKIYIYNKSTLIRKYANNLNTSKIFTSVEFDRVLILLIKQARLSRQSLDPALKSLLKSRHTHTQIRTDTVTHACVHLVFVVKIKAKSKQTGLNATVEMLFITMPLQLQLPLYVFRFRFESTDQSNDQ